MLLAEENTERASTQSRCSGLRWGGHLSLPRLWDCCAPQACDYQRASRETNMKKTKPTSIAKAIPVTVIGQCGWALVTQGNPILINLREFESFAVGMSGRFGERSRVFGILRQQNGTRATVNLATMIPRAEADQVVRDLYAAAIAP